MTKARILLEDLLTLNELKVKAYHGTRYSFDKFKTRRQVSGYSYSMGAYFSDSEKEAKRYGKEVKSYSLTFNKLLDLSFIDEDSDRGKQMFFDYMKDTHGIKFEDTRTMIYDNPHFGYTTLEQLDKKFNLIPMLKRKGFDGVAFKEGDGVTYVVFNADQIEGIK